MPTQPHWIERRAFGRRPTYLHAIVYRPRRAPVRCVVRDISIGGALLDFGEIVHLPSRIRVVWEGSGLEAECDVRHTHGTCAGVQFLGDVGARIAAVAAEAPQEVPVTSGDHPDKSADPMAATPGGPVEGICLVKLARSKQR